MFEKGAFSLMTFIRQVKSGKAPNLKLTQSQSLAAYCHRWTWPRQEYPPAGTIV